MNDTIRTLYDTILDRRDHPSDNSYTRYLFDQGIDKILKKVGRKARRSSSPRKTAIMRTRSVRSPT